MTADQLARRRLMQNVNSEVRALAERVDRFGDWQWPFLCECGDAACDEPVVVSVQLFDDLKRDDVALLANGHPARVGKPQPRKATLRTLRDGS